MNFVASDAATAIGLLGALSAEAQLLTSTADVIAPLVDAIAGTSVKTIDTGAQCVVIETS